MMKLFVSLIFLLPALASSQDANEVAMAEYYVGIIYKGDNWKPYSAPGAP